MTPKTNIKRQAFYALRRKAIERGYVVGGRILEEHVADGLKKGRERIIVEGGQLHNVLEATLTQNSTTREFSTYELVESLRETFAQTPGIKIPSRRTILRWIKKEKYKWVKHTTKVGLNRGLGI
jgi:hypothetical protein